MARAYSADLRRKVLSSYAAGKGTMRELAERFDISYGWVLKIAAAQR
jgi:transposase